MAITPVETAQAGKNYSHRRGGYPHLTRRSLAGANRSANASGPTPPEIWCGEYCNRLRG